MASPINLHLNMINNLLVVSKPKEIEQQEEKEKRWQKRLIGANISLLLFQYVPGLKHTGKNKR